MIDKRVQIIKDTVTHRIPIGKIVKIKSESDKLIRGKKCYNVLDYCCYISEDDFKIISDNNENNFINEDNDLDIETNYGSNYEPIKSKKWFDDYTDKNVISEKPKKGDRVYAQNVTALTPNGTQMKANDGKFIIYEEKNGRFWLRREDKKDLNEYFCSIDKIKVYKL